MRTANYRERVCERFLDWWEATMLDEIAESARTGIARTKWWWAAKAIELRALAERETPQEGFVL